MPTINVPYPVSANRYWRVARNRIYASAEASQYKRQVGMIAMSAGMRPLAGAVHVEIVLHPRTTQDGRTSRTRLDLDNCVKVVLDSLNGIAWHDDAQIVRILAEIGAGVANGGVTINVY